MLGPALNRVKKSYSLGLPKQDKQNQNNNIQLQPNPNHKLLKLRQSLQQCNKPDKIVPTFQVQQKQQNQQKEQKEDNQILGVDLKKKYTEIIKRDYSHQILKILIDRSCDVSEGLAKHTITHQLRAKMVDWMIQVLSSYKMSEQAFFRSVKYMDIFFKKVTRKLQLSDLHLIGVAAMFIASKYQQIYPFKINTIYDKICRKKFAKRQIIDMQQQILSILQFQLQQSTCFDIILHVLNEIQIPIQAKQWQYLQKVCLYLGKMSMHCTELAWKQDSKLAAAVIFIGLKTVEQVETKLISDNYILPISELCQIKTCELLQMSQQLLNLAKNFHKQYQSLTNLKKFNNTQYLE